MDQDSEISKFLRNLMSCGDRPRRHPDPGVQDEGATDCEPTHHIVKFVCHQNEPTDGTAMIMGSSMAVVPMQYPLEHGYRQDS
jgi:hypothetical protein